uniref:Tyrosine specific protein phosphatases domain-containing protein n=1 Tax=Ananas comosus var. bracteatus TaxID=296719 RepID=A0A6V7NIE7_ANACO|nr:unnamed protein product [Ananas comosus var. bracteatus]
MQESATTRRPWCGRRRSSARSGRRRSDRNHVGPDGRDDAPLSSMTPSTSSRTPAVAAVEGEGEGGGCSLVHCVCGALRSAAIVVVYLMWRHTIPFDAALRSVKAARAAADPNLSFATQMLRRQPRADAAANSSGPARRVLRLAPHSPCAPLHLDITPAAAP